MSKSIEQELAAAVARTMGTPADYVEFAKVIETFRGQTVWEGIVKTFEAIGGAQCYAWAVETDKGPQYVTVLRQPPVDTALDAVRAWIASTHRK
jgi:hypothetical protein